jgi:hypothetical protein
MACIRSLARQESPSLRIEVDEGEITIQPHIGRLLPSQRGVRNADPLLWNFILVYAGLQSYHGSHFQLKVPLEPT